jgi:ArsR family transcriptional regulator, arsenate/arsenite/antimonite-responsive transcriptional repressor
VKKNLSARPGLTTKQFELIAKALSDPRRMQLLEVIGGEEHCPCQRLRQEFPVSKATISHHIKELVRAGLVDARKDGQFLHCEIRRETLEAYTAELLRRAGGKANTSSVA